jgi:hypothetical protein
MLSVFNAMLGFGMTFSQIAAGYLIKAVGFTLPYAISTGLMFIVCLCLLCTHTESKKRSTIKTSTLATSIFTFCTQPDAVIKDKRRLLFVYYLVFVPLGDVQFDNSVQHAILNKYVPPEIPSIPQNSKYQLRPRSAYTTKARTVYTYRKQKTKHNQNINFSYKHIYVLYPA